MAVAELIKRRRLRVLATTVKDEGDYLGKESILVSNAHIHPDLLSVLGSFE
jgi:hypothetical protein